MTALPSIDVLILSTRPITHGDALAVKQALIADMGLRAVVLDALLCEVGFESAAAPSSGGTSKFKSLRSKEKLRRALLSNEVTRVALLARGISRDRRRLEALISSARPRAIAVFDDRRVRPELVAVEVARRHAIPTIIVPFAVSTTESDLYLRRSRPELEVGRRPWLKTKAYIARKHPRQIQTGPDGRSFTFFTPLETVFLQWARLLPNFPWVWGGAGSDMVCAIGEDHVRYLLSGGVDSGKIVVTGQPSLDVLAKTSQECNKLRQHLVAKYRLRGDRPLVLCAVPQHGEHAMTDWATHWRLTDELFAGLAESGCDVALSLHPKSRRTDYDQKAAFHRLPILDERLVDTLPTADVLVGAFSSTIPWATGLGIPAIVVDALDSRYELFRNQDGIQIVATHRELTQILRAFSSSQAALAKARDAAERGRLRLGRIDGRNAHRVAAAIESLVRGNTIKPCTHAQTISGSNGELPVAASILTRPRNQDMPS